MVNDILCFQEATGYSSLSMRTHNGDVVQPLNRFEGRHVIHLRDFVELAIRRSFLDVIYRKKCTTSPANLLCKNKYTF